MAGRVNEGLPLIEWALERVQRANRPAEAQVRSYLAGAYVAAGRLEEACGAIEAALTVARERNERGTEAHCLRLRGEITSQWGPGALEAAHTDLRGALALAEPRSMRPLVAHCHLDLGKLSRRTDGAGQAHEHLATATMMYRDMGLTYWGERAEQEVTRVT